MPNDAILSSNIDLLGWMLRRSARAILLAVVLIGVHAFPGWTRMSTNAQSADSIGVIDDVPLSSKGRAIAPSGWRRTVDGWQHVSTWTAYEPTPALSLGEQIDAQRAAQPRVLDVAMTGVRTIPPHWFALGQVSAIAALFLLARRDQTCQRGVE